MTEKPIQTQPESESIQVSSFVDRVILFCLKNRLVVGLCVAFFIIWGIIVAPFDWQPPLLPRNPVSVDAIPDIGENQQIVFAEWEGRSPQDIEDQVTYPLTTALLGIPRVKTIRSNSFFGFSTIFIIFDEKAEFYWTRSRVLEKLNSLPEGSLPAGVQPVLGPDATALGQVFWYYLEGRDPDGKPVGGWDLNELRSLQDWHVRYALLSASGVSEVASVGGFVQEYQIDVDPDALRAHRVMLGDVFNAVRDSNVDVGARSIEVNRVEYMIRGLGYIKNVHDIERAVVKTTDNVPIRVSDVATVSRGPEMRRGVLDLDGAEAVGGVVVVRYGANPLETIKNIKGKIAELAPGLPTKVIIAPEQPREAVSAYASQHGFEAYHEGEPNHEAWVKWLSGISSADWPSWVTTSQATIVPFYDRTGLIYETLGTLNSALYEEILITIIVVIVLAMHLRSSALISMVMPMAVLLCFIAMKTFGVDANIVALSGIAIAIGTIVDMGIIICENILKHLAAASPDENRLYVVYRAASEVGSAVLTAVSTTVVGFLPVFAMTGAEGKLFRPLAFTKTFCLISSVIVALTIIPPLAHAIIASRPPSGRSRLALLLLLFPLGFLSLFIRWWVGLPILLFTCYHLVAERLPRWSRKLGPWSANAVALVLVGYLIAEHWMPLGADRGILPNFAFVALIVGTLMGLFILFQFVYPLLLRWFLNHKIAYLCLPGTLILFALCAWLGFGRVFGFIPAAASSLGVAPERIIQSRVWSKAVHLLPGFGKEFMPPLDEGSFLYMPTTMAHAGIGEAIDIIAKQDQAIAGIPEVESVVGKLGRVDSPLDPAPINMIETVINYRSEYVVDKDGRRVNYRYDSGRGDHSRTDTGELIPDPNGRPFRQWRDEIKSPNDIWAEIVKAAQIPGTTSAPKLQPIAARLVMLQSGMRAPMGIKVKGPDLDTIERVGVELEKLLKEVPSVEASTVIADRIVGTPYLEIAIDRDAISRYGLSIRAVQDAIEVAIGGMPITRTVEGRERYGVRVRYKRELRDQIESLGHILVAGMNGVQIPLDQLSEIEYVRGPMSIKSEDTFLVSYVLFDKKPGFAEVDVIEDCQAALKHAADAGRLVMPAGVSYQFAGTYENQIRAQRTLSLIVPLALFVIFMILYFQFESYVTTFLVFTGITVAGSGGFLLIWLYGQPWFLDFTLLGVHMRELFQVHTINLSVAIWVGFLALFGIATDDGVVIATYLDQSFAKRKIESVKDIRKTTLEAGKRRIRPCLMTTATTILALIPVLTSTGRGADIMMPMAIPSFGGMTVELLTLFMVPVLYCWVRELKFRWRGHA